MRNKKIVKRNKEKCLRKGGRYYEQNRERLQKNGSRTLERVT